MSSRRLGEVALVQHSSPVARLGVTFHSTLFDENAASHLALGQAYRFTMQDAENITEEQFAQQGGNNSKIHSDFMIGSAKMDIDGIRQDGISEPVMRRGEWAFSTCNARSRIAVQPRKDSSITPARSTAAAGWLSSNQLLMLIA
jgi:aminopeptidase